MHLRWLILLWSGAGCKDPDPAPPTVVPCGVDTVLLTGSDRVKVVDAGCGEVLLTDYRVVGDGEFTLEVFTDGSRLVVGVRSQRDGSVFRALHMSGHVQLEGAGGLVWARTAWGVGDPSGPVVPASVELGEDGLPDLGQETSPPSPVQSTSSWFGLVGRTGGPAAIVGALAARTTPFSVAYDADGTVHAVWGDPLEPLPVDEGAVLFVDPLFMGVGADPNALLTAYVDAVAVENLVEIDPATSAPTMWRVDGPQGSAQGVAVGLDALDGLADDPLLSEVSVVRVGAEWQSMPGSWEAGPGFDPGMAVLATSIADSGRIPGLAIDPVRVDPSAAVFLDHADWWVRDDEGLPALHDGLAVLDVTQPDAADWLSDRVSERTDEGWRLLELSGLDAAALRGRRSAPVSHITALRIAVELVRSAAGPQTRLVAADGPSLPLVGLVDAFRPADATQSLALRARALAALAPTQGRWWSVDPGPVSSVAPLHTGDVALAIAAGGGWSLGGDPGETGAVGVLRSDWVLSLGETTEVSDPLAAVGAGLDGGLGPTAWVLADGTSILLNTGEEPVEVESPGGVEAFGGIEAEAGTRTLPAQSGEVWR